MWDWDKLIEETYGRPYSFQQQDGCRFRGIYALSIPSDDAYDFENDSIPEEVNGDEMGVSFSSWLARDPKQPLNTSDEWEREHGIDIFWRRNFYPSIEVVANDLYQRGLIPAGEYVINIDW